jgi:hypothetical protein
MKNKLIFLILIISASFICKTFPQGDLLITPNRIVFKERQIKQVISLINVGSETTTFTVSFVQRRMNENGSFTVITKPDLGQMFADSLLRIYPRQVTLLPGEGQVVMLQRKRNTTLQAGEYRSHLYFRSQQKYKALEQEDLTNNSNSLSVILTPVFGMSIPIIIRSGEVGATAKISDLKIAKLKGSPLTFTIHREGNISMYGDLTVEYIPVKGKPYVIGKQRGIAVYTNINKRYISMMLDNKTKFKEGKGALKISYTSRDDSRKKIVFATEQLVLGI